MITVGGPHGTGKSTYAKALAEAFELRYVSAGNIFRQLANEGKMTLEALTNTAARDPTIDHLIDERTKLEATRRQVVIDGQIAAWMVRNLADAKVLIMAPEEIRFKRIATREGISLEEARRQTISRERIQRERYQKYYGIDVDDLSIYDVIIDTSLHPIVQTTLIVIEQLRRFLLGKGTVVP